MLDPDKKPDTAAPKVSFVSLGCPKALVDSERIVTRLRAEGYELSREHAGSDLVIVNTCGFLDSAKAESLGAIGSALKENGKVIVTGCMGAEPESISAAYPHVLAITGPQQYESVVEAVHRALPPQHDPFLDLVPPEGIKLTPRHYAYLKISEGCNNRCTLLHHSAPARRSGVAPGRRRAARGGEAGHRRRQGTAGDLAGHLGLWARHQIRGEPVARPRVAREVHRSQRRTRRTRRLGAAALRLPLPARRRGHSADGRAQDSSLSRHPVPACRARRAQAHEAARRRKKKRLERIAKWREICPDITLRSTFIVGFPGETEGDFELLLQWLEEAALDRVGCFRYEPVRGAAANDLAAAVPDEVKEERWHRFMQAQQKISTRRLKRKVGTRQQVIIDEVGPTVAKGRSMADAPEIDGAVYVASRRPLRVGEIATVKIERADEYDLHGTAVGF